MTTTTEQIKSRLDIVSVVSSYITLHKAGRNLKARCPFHNERTPSFVVSPDRNTYHCFGCGKGGDIFSFVEEIEGVDFKEALKTLADKAGVALGAYDQKEKSETDTLRVILARAAQLYQEALLKNDDALAYLKKRGVSSETIDRFGIGYVPNEWEWLGTRLQGEGYSNGMLEKAGLVIPGTRGFYDRFRGRIMFPIRDAGGRVIGFSGRVFGGDDTTAKYINSPATVLYDKSKTVYGYDTAKDAIRKSKTCVVVEGQMDVILSQQAGQDHTIAASGTAFTEGHADLICRLAETVILVFDADDAGLVAARKSVPVILSRGMSVQAVLLPLGTDPADMVRQSPDQWKQLLNHALPIIDFYIQTVRALDITQEEKRKKIEELALPHIAHIPNLIERAQHIRKVATEIGVSEDTVAGEMARRSVEWRREAETGVSHHAPQTRSGTTETLSRREIIERRLWSIFAWKSGDADFDIETIRNKYAAIFGDEALARFDNMSDAVKNKFALKAEFSLGTSNPETINAEMRELLVRLENENILSRISELTHEMNTARQSGESKKEIKLLKELSDIRQKQEILTRT